MNPPDCFRSVNANLGRPRASLLLWALAAAVSGLLLGGCTAAPSVPTAARPFENSLGLKFVPVPGTSVLFAIWETRVRDFEAFANATGFRAEGKIWTWQNGRTAQFDGFSWRNPGFAQNADHPVCAVSWDDAQKFCRWLTQRERDAGRLGPDQSYRLPTDAEWSLAAGLTNEVGATPKELDRKIKDVYPWGSQWMPPKNAGNFADDGVHPEGSWEKHIEGYHDDYMFTAPVGQFTPNRYGIYDLSGNVMEWSEDRFSNDGEARGLRGGSFRSATNDHLFSSLRTSHATDYRNANFGFRLVVTTGK